jgi:adenylyltransferase/sulfurtransferase
MMSDTGSDNLSRYPRQIVFRDFGPAGQRALMSSRVLVVGVGGLGTWTAELLARAGVGFLRLVDDDNVDLTNIHRQSLYDESDADTSKPKVQAAAERLGCINSDVMVETANARLERTNIGRLAGDVDLILDGTDNFATRFLINDYAVKHSKPWVFTGVMGAEGHTMTIIPRRTPCLRCIMNSPPPDGEEPNSRDLGILGPTVSALASFQVAEAIKILSGTPEKINPYIIKINLWNNSFQRIDLDGARLSTSCPCCAQGKYEFLEP